MALTTPERKIKNMYKIMTFVGACRKNGLPKNKTDIQFGHFHKM